ncbi:hypothetical protein PM082_023001 [Marasmius tenuissimus]|nr:hypothetical protein PM082_023001 [Marasmius tenuissimus]
MHSSRHDPTIPEFGDKTPQAKYKTMASWFIGPRGENYGLMMEKSAKIVARVCSGRESYFPGDPRFIDSGNMIGSDDFEDGVAATDKALKFILKGLSEHAVPFFSPRYAGHMSFDVSLPALLGYHAAMVYNQNNVTPEASPFSSFVERELGKDLCRMLGYPVKSKRTPLQEDKLRVNKPGLNLGWGERQ